MVGLQQILRNSCDTNLRKMTEVSWALVGVTSVLAILTGWYAIEMRRTVNRMDRAREEVSRPVLAFQVIPWQPQLLNLRIQNVGGGPAVGVKGTIEARLKPGSANIPWSYPLLGAGKYEDFGFPAPPDSGTEERFGLHAIRAKVIEVRADFVYKSVAGCEYELKDSIQIQQLTDDWLASRMMVTQDHPERMWPRIAKALEDLVRNTR